MPTYNAYFIADRQPYLKPITTEIVLPTMCNTGIGWATSPDVKKLEAEIEAIQINKRQQYRNVRLLSVVEIK
jgi:hypothetical protein